MPGLVSSAQGHPAGLVRGHGITPEAYEDARHGSTAAAPFLAIMLACQHADPKTSWFSGADSFAWGRSGGSAFHPVNRLIPRT